ncbi:AF4/FMR2 family member 1 [Hibiscus syriacus]|uniref:AF4/FMR2 family member 1 n=1 Tax=Hibiscus syriacus TaxID=106335 RepID=A0A6A2ZUH5_HIBSY|nr:AF4/FMR2 family member 1 [Hibiscus syriacus]
MAVMRSMSKLNIKAPPPSPIPTATGSRSAANEILTDFLEKSLHIPDLTLPETQALRQHGLSDKIDFQSLVSRERDSLERFMKSARKFGAVVIWRHGIETEELRETTKEAAKVFEVLEERDTGLDRNSGGKRDEIVWVGCKEERMEWARQYIGAHLYSSFSEKIENVASKLEEVAEELGKILVEIAGKAGKKGVPKGVSHLSIYKYNNKDGDKSADQDPIGEEEEEENQHCCDYTLSLHLPTKHCQFSAKYGHRLLTFDADPDTIIVTFGQLLEASNFL